MQEDADAAGPSGRRRRPLGLARPAKEQLDLRGEHRELHRLRDVLVGPLRVAGEDVIGLLARRQHDDRQPRGRGFGAQAPGELEAVQVRHRDIGDQEVWPLLADLAEGLIPVGGGRDDVAMLLQERLDQLADLAFVVDEEDTLAGHP